MAKRIEFNGAEVGFPAACVVCQAPAEQDYQVSKVFAYGKSTITVNLPVPMCARHHELAVKKNQEERLVGKLGLGAGALIGIASAAGLISYWAASGQGTGPLNILLALVVGAGLLLAVWVAAVFWLAPLFAGPETKAVRQAVKIVRYWPANQRMELEFYNEQVADRIVSANAGRMTQPG